MSIITGTGHFATIVLINGILVGIIGGQPDKLVKQPKLHYRLVQQQNVLQPLVTLQRFYRGILVGLIDGTLAIGLFSGYFLAFAIGSSNRIIVGVMGGIIFGLASGFATSLMAGIIYGFGPMLAFKIASLTERRLGQIGIALTILGIIMASLPYLIS